MTTRTPTSIDQHTREIFGRYVLGPKLARGAFGTVHVARSLATNSVVAVKLQHVSDAKRRDEFEREARLLARVHDPHVVRLIDFGTLDDGSIGVVMEFVEGITLTRYVLRHQSALDWRTAVGITLGVLEGLHAVHEAGIVHRDIKPDNVMVPLRGVGPVKIVDFGVARSAATGDSATGRLMGSVAYMAPEQLLGRHVDARADLYAAGAVLYELLATQLPFEGSVAEVIDRKRHSAGPVSIENPMQRDWPARLERVVLSLLRNDPAERPDSALACIELLEDVLRLDRRGALDR
ncbi:MAG: serine/threonine protein kinase [Myxococcales bacterium]|nr:serine/threonine protein kinase [Myxococcales bacterium]